MAEPMAGVVRRRERTGARLGLRAVALGYLVVILLAPLAIMTWKTFEGGLGPVVEALTHPYFLHALQVTVIIALIAVPLNALFGLVAALILVRRRVPGRTLVSAAIDLPLALSPVVVGLALVLVWGRKGWWGDDLAGHGIQVIYALPGMVLATIFVSLPFVVREVVPVLREIGTDQEQAAATLGASPWQAFRRITLPAIRWGLAYGVVLTTARALGEFGAVAVVSGRLAGSTETLTLHVEERFQNFNLIGAYTASFVLALLALVAVAAMHVIRPREETL